MNQDKWDPINDGPYKEFELFLEGLSDCCHADGVNCGYAIYDFSLGKLLNDERETAI